MNRFGKIIGILLAAVLSFGLAGCTAGGGGLGGNDACNHARVSYRDGGSDFHYVTCDDCGVDLRSEAHRFTGGVCKDCGRPDEQPEEHVHKPQFVAGIQPDCEHEGRSDYYRCACGAMFRDPDGYDEIKNQDELYLPPSHRNEWVPEVPSDCYTQGHQAYYECTSCGRWFWDFEGTNEIADHDAVTLPILHEAYMLQSDETGHWQFCLKCEQRFDFSEHTFIKGVCAKCGFPEQEITTPHEHPLTRVEPKEPDCEHEGVREHYKCPTCKRVFDDPEGYHEISEADTVLPRSHDIRLVPEQEATCTEDGYAEHMECALCSRWFYDWDGQSEIVDKTDLTYPAAHDFQPVTDAKTHCEQCSRCGATQNVGEHTFVDGVCSTCERGDGLRYTLRDDGTYAVSLNSYFWWEKTCDYIYIPSQYQGKTVTEIAQDAFNGRASLAEIVIPNTIQTIGMNAFYGCTALTEFTVPVGVTSFDASVLSGCVGLQRLSVAAGNATYYAEENCLIERETDTLVRGISTSVIPVGVKQIGNFAFIGCTALTQISLPAGLTAIENGAFEGCTNLTTVTVGGVLPWLTKSVFYDCPIEYTEYENAQYLGNADSPHLQLVSATGTDIAGVTIPADTACIGANAFRDCASLSALYIPAGIESIGYNAFANCTGLTAVTFAGDTTAVEGNAFSGAVVGTLTLSGGMIENLNGGINPRKVVVTGGAVPARAFTNCGAVEIELRDGVTAVGASAFWDCESVVTLTVPDSVVSIGDNAFFGLDRLEEATVPAIAIPYITAFDRNSSFRKVTVTSGATLPDNAFEGCRYLTDVTLPDEMTEIGDRAFANCVSLSAVRLPDDLINLGRYAFEGCTQLGQIVVPDGVTALDGTFGSCTALQKVTLGAGIGSMAAATFYRCSALSEVHIADVAQWLSIAFTDSQENPLSANCKLYVGDSLLTALRIPAGVTAIGDYAFEGCTQLTSVTPTDDVRSIGVSTFSGCDNVTEIALPARLQSIGALAFSGTGLTQVTLPDSCSAIGERAFYGCSDLTQVKLGAGIRTLGALAFYQCNRLTQIHVDAIDDWLQITFSSIEQNPLSSSCALYVGGSLLTRLEIPDTVTAVGAYAFAGCSWLTEISIPDSVTSIGALAFQGCGLHAVTVSGSVSVIGDYAFSKCGLETVTLGNGVTEIGSHVFSECGSLATVTIPDSMTAIGESAFYRCNNITAATLPAWAVAHIKTDKLQSVTVTSGDIADSALAGLADLTSVEIAGNVGSVGASAFANCGNLATVTLENGVTTIGASAFRACKVTEITIPASVTSLGNGAFSNCADLATVYWNAINCADNSGQFSGCGKLTALHVGAAVRALPDMRAPALTGVYITDLAAWVSVAFASADCNPLGVAHALYLNNTRLVNLAVPDGVETVANYAFYGSEVLTVSIPATVTALGDDVFGACSALTAINVDGNNTAYASQSGILYDKTYWNVLFAPLRVTGVIEMPTNLLSIPADAFAGRTSVTGVRVADVNTWAKVAFGNIDANPLYIAHKLYVGQADAPATALEVGGDIGKFAFAGCTGVTQLTLTNTAHIGVSAFEGWNNVTVYADSLSGWCAVTFDNPQANPLHGGNAVLYVKSGQASNQQVNEIPLSANIKDVGAYAFYNYKYLNTIEVNGKIGTEAFYGCEQLTAAWLGTSVKTVESKAFADSGLTTVSYRGTQAQWESITKAPDWVNDPAAVTVQYQA